MMHSRLIRWAGLPAQCTVSDSCSFIEAIQRTQLRQSHGHVVYEEEDDEEEDSAEDTRWCTALPHDSVPGPLVATVLGTWLPVTALAITDAEWVTHCDGIENRGRLYDDRALARVTVLYDQHLARTAMPQCNFETEEDSMDMAFPRRLRSFRMDHTRQSITNESVRSIARCFGRHLRALSIRSCMNVSSGSCDAIAAEMPRLTSLTLAKVSIDDEGIAQVVLGCPHLTVLNIEECEKITKKVATSIAKIGPLKTLFLGGTAMTDQSFVFLAQRAARDRTISDGNTSASTLPNNEALRPQLQCLETLYLQSTCITDAGVNALVSFPALTDLNLRSCRGLGADVGRHLQPLVMSGRLLKLRLGLTHITDASVCAMFAPDPSTHSNDQQRSDDDHRIVAGSTTAEGRSRLELLSLNQTAVTSVGITVLARAAGHCLRFLDLAMCDSVDDAACLIEPNTDGRDAEGTTYCAFGQQFMPWLEELSLRQCPITDRTVAVIAAECPSLRAVDFGHTTVHDDAIQTLALTSVSPALQVLDVSFTPVTDMRAIGWASVTIALVKASGCRNVLPDGTATLRSGDVRLRHTDVSDCILPYFQSFQVCEDLTVRQSARATRGTIPLH